MKTQDTESLTPNLKALDDFFGECAEKNLTDKQISAELQKRFQARYPNMKVEVEYEGE